MDRKSKQQYTARSHAKKDNNTLELGVEHFDLESLLQLSGAGDRPKGFYHFDAERNLALLALGRSNPASTLHTDQSQYLSQVQEIKSRSFAGVEGLSLLDRGRLIDFPKLNKNSSADKTSSHKTDVPHLLSTELEVSLTRLISDQEEIIEMADKDLETSSRPTLEEELEGLGISSDDDEYVANGDESKDQQERTQILSVKSPDIPQSDVLSSNIALAKLYTEQQVVSPLTVSTGTKKKIIRAPKLKPPKKPQKDIQTLSTPAHPISESVKKTTLPSSGIDKLDYDIIMEGLNMIVGTIATIQEEHNKIPIILESINEKIENLDTRMGAIEASLSILNANIINIDASIKTSGTRAYPITSKSQPAAAEETSQARSPEIEVKQPDDLTSQDQELIEISKGVYRHIDADKLVTLNEQKFIQIQLLGGFEKYFKSQYPGNHEVDLFLKAIDAGTATGAAYMAVDRVLTRLSDKLHKKQYLPFDPSISRYTTSVGSTSTSSLPQAPGTSTLPGMPFELPKQRKQRFE